MVVGPAGRDPSIPSFLDLVASKGTSAFLSSPQPIDVTCRNRAERCLKAYVPSQKVSPKNESIYSWTRGRGWRTFWLGSFGCLFGDLSDTYFPVEVIGLKNLQDGEVTWRCGRQEGLEPWCPETITRQILASPA